MKISWGHKIAFVYISFICGILFLVFKANGERYDLVTENYYEAELKYQDVIDQKDRVAGLSAQPEVVHTADAINFALPPEFNKVTVTGEVYLYSPSDAKKDLRKSFTIEDGKFSMPLPLLSGMYDLKLSWQANGNDYLLEKKLFF